jgi:hypothetical protein
MRSGQDEDETIRPIGNGCTDAPFNGIASLDYTRKRDLLNLSMIEAVWVIEIRRKGIQSIHRLG